MVIDAKRGQARTIHGDHMASRSTVTFCEAQTIIGGIMADKNSASAPLTALAAEQYVLLTTMRRTGTAVATPVWVAPLDGALVVTTRAGAGKVKRIRHTPRVTLQACDRVGNPHEGAVIVEAHATVHDDKKSVADLDRAVSAKYGEQYAAIKAMGARRGPHDPGSVMVRLVTPA